MSDLEVGNDISVNNDIQLNAGCYTAVTNNCCYLEFVSALRESPNQQYR